jgi:hypothetical protein
MFTIRTLASCLVFAATVAPLTAVTLNQFNIPFTENFDGLATATDSVVPPGWAFTETGTSANTTYGAGTGSSTTGNTYSFGATGSTERAFGALRTSGVAATIGTVVANDAGNTITELTIQFTGEQWRLGALGRVDRLDFGYSTDATSLADGAWLDVDALDFVGPVTSGLVGGLDGNAPENQFLVSYTLTGLNLLSGGSLWLRWVDFDASGSDDGLEIDNFSITAVQTEGGEVQTVPDQLPTGVVAMVMGALLAFGSARRRVSAMSAATEPQF